MTSRLQLFIIALTLVAAPLLSARANDSAFSGVSGTPKPMRGEHRSIAMQSEKIVIVADEKGYSTTVDFVFRNDGGKTSVQMGFPESSFGDVTFAKNSAFLRFATWIDGQKVPAKRVIVSTGEGTTDAYWLKTVSFAPKQVRHIRVSYRSRMGGTTTWGTRRALTYDFTGQNWKGKVERSDLEIRVQKPGLWIAMPIFEGDHLVMGLEIGAKGATFRKTWRNWQAQGDFTFGLAPAVPFWMWDRHLLSGIVPDAKWFPAAITFRVGAVPAELPLYSFDLDAPPAFTRAGVTYISLSHLDTRLGGWTNDKSLQWNAQTRAATLRVGTKTLQFSPNAPLSGTSLRPVLLRKEGGSTLYVPLAPVAKTLGLTFKIDAKNRLFDLNSGTLLKK